MKRTVGCNSWDLTHVIYVYNMQEVCYPTHAECYIYIYIWHTKRGSSSNSISGSSTCISFAIPRTRDAVYTESRRASWKMISDRVYCWLMHNIYRSPRMIRGRVSIDGELYIYMRRLSERSTYRSITQVRLYYSHQLYAYKCNSRWFSTCQVIVT